MRESLYSYICQSALRKLPSAGPEGEVAAPLETLEPDAPARGGSTPVDLASIGTARAVIAWFTVKKYHQGEAVKVAPRSHESSALTRMLMRLRTPRLEVVA